MIKLAIADDHQVVIDGLTGVINDSQEEIEIVGTALNGEDMLVLLKRYQVDVAILDISMPGMEGAATLKALRKEYPKVKVLMLTMHKDTDRIVMMLQSGAHGYLLKNRSAKEVVKAIHALMNGQLYYPEEIQKMAFQSLIPQDLLENEIKQIIFTSKEEEILALLALGDQVKAIADKLFISPKTVESHKTSLMKKIGARNVQDVVRFAVKNGYCPD